MSYFYDLIFRDEDTYKTHFMTKRLILLFTVFTFFLSCNISEKPIFIGIENIKIQDSNSKKNQITADALFNNPNAVGGKLKTENLKIYVNDNEVANFASEEFEVPSKKNFTIPLTVAVATDSIFGRKNLGSLLGSIISQSFKVQYKGDIKYKIWGYSSSYTIDKTENIKIKL